MRMKDLRTPAERLYALIEAHMRKMPLDEQRRRWRRVKQIVRRLEERTK